MARKGLPKSIIKKYGISKKAWSVYRGRSKSKSSSGKSKTKTTKKKRKYMARKKKRRSGKSWTQTAFKMIRIGALVAPGAAAAINAHKQGWGAEGMLDQVMQVYTGYSFVHQEWKAEYIAKGWIPYIMANLATHGIPKLVGLIRRL